MTNIAQTRVVNPLVALRVRPTVPFGGRYRIIDFTLSNCLHSGLRQVLVLTQYKSHSLQRHLRDGWSIFNPRLNEYITAVPPQMRTGNSWYEGTADALFQNLFLLERSGAENVVILSCDHVYRMNYAHMLNAHRESFADVTVAYMETSVNDARSLGVMTIDRNNIVQDFQEKPPLPREVPGRPGRALSSMGVYVFSTELLCRELQADHERARSTHDFGHNILPRLINEYRVFGYRLGASDDAAVADSYWRDVGTIDSYYSANMDLLRSQPPFDVYRRDWPVHTAQIGGPPARIEVDVFSQPADVAHSMIGHGVVVNGVTVRHAILSPNVQIAADAIVENAILFEGVELGEGARLNNCIVDKNVQVPAGETIGLNAAHDVTRFTVSDDGITVVPRCYRFSTDGQRCLPIVPQIDVQLPRVPEPAVAQRDSFIRA